MTDPKPIYVYPGYDPERKVWILDPELHIPSFSPVCTFCRHEYRLPPRHCRAFYGAEGIPMEIWMGQNDHTQPYEGDHGVQFERIGDNEEKPQGMTPEEMAAQIEAQLGE